jgi:hypothetical protein
LGREAPAHEAACSVTLNSLDPLDAADVLRAGDA